MQQSLELSDPALPQTRYPVVGTQKDIRYHGTTARGVLNSSASTGMPFWSINPYIGCAFGCAYCYARYAHRYVMERATDGATPDASLADDREALPPWLAFERRIFVKRNAAQILRATLRSDRESLGPIWQGTPIVIGTATDPYQPAERLFRVTRDVLEVLAEERRLRLVIITKSPLITRDADVLTRIARRSRLTIHLSLITLDRDLARRIEPRAPTPESRLRAVRRLSAAGIDIGINVMPVLPGITDAPDGLRELVRQVAAAGASHVNTCALRLRVTARKRYLPWIASEFPELAAQYRGAYAASSQVNDRYREGLRQFMRGVCRKAGIHYGTPDERAFEGRAGGAWERDSPLLPGDDGAPDLPNEPAYDSHGAPSTPPHAPSSREDTSPEFHPPDTQFELGL